MDLKTIFMKYLRWVIIAVGAVAIFKFNDLFPNVAENQKDLYMGLIALPLIACVLTVSPQQLKEDREARKK